MSSRIATVFGGTGFLGHAVVQALAARGYQVRVPTRDLDKAADLRVMGSVGQIVPLRVSLRSDGPVLEVSRGSDLVFNLIGELFESKGNSFQIAHVETAARIARAAKTAGVSRLVHVSALGADVNAKARYARTKAIGEEAVRAFFPDAVLFRPSLIFGPRDRFFNLFALMARYMPFLPLIGGGHTRFQPIYVGDVARAIMASLDRPETGGNLFLLGGPEVYTFRDLMEKICKTTGHNRPLIPVPWQLALAKAWFLEKLPNPILSRDMVELMRVDNIVCVQEAAGNIPLHKIGTLSDLDILPTHLDDILPRYLG